MSSAFPLLGPSLKIGQAFQPDASIPSGWTSLTYEKRLCQGFQAVARPVRPAAAPDPVRRRLGDDPVGRHEAQSSQVPVVQVIEPVILDIHDVIGRVRSSSTIGPGRSSGSSPR